MYANLGAKFSDLVYSDTFGEKNLILVLDEKDDGCDSVASVSNLKQCLLNSVYQFNLSGYIADSGKIDQKFISRNKEQFSHVSKEKLDEIIGRTYVTFVESSINLQVETKNVLRLGCLKWPEQGVNRLQIKSKYSLDFLKHAFSSSKPTLLF